MTHAETATPGWTAYLPLALITALAGALRFYGLDGQSLWMDEVLTLLSSRASTHRILLDPPVDPNVPPLYYLLMASLRGLGDGEVALRWPSAVAGVLSIPLMYAVARRWLGRAALFAALLLAVSPLHVWYSQEARPYALLILLALLTVRLMQQAQDTPGALWPRAGFVITAAAAFYVHTVAIAFLAALAVYLLVVEPRRHWARWAALFAAVALVSLPGVFLLLRIPPTVSANPFYLFRPSHVAYTLWTFASGYSLGPNLIELRAEGASSVRRDVLLIAPIMGLFCGLLAWGLVQLWRTRRQALVALGLWLVAPIGFVILGSWVTSHPYNVRYTLPALPPALMLVAIGAGGLRPRALRLGAAVLLLTCSAGALWNYYTNPRYSRDDNRGAAAFIRAGAGPGDLVVATAAYTTVPLGHYLAGSGLALRGYPTPATARRREGEGPLGAVFVQPDRVGDDLQRLIGDRTGFWLFLSRTFHGDPQGHVERYADTHYRRAAQYDGPGVRVIHYRRPDASAAGAP